MEARWLRLASYGETGLDVSLEVVAESSQSWLLRRWYVVNDLIQARSMPAWTTCSSSPVIVLAL